MTRIYLGCSQINDQQEKSGKKPHSVGMHRSVEKRIRLSSCIPLGMHPYRMQDGFGFCISTERRIPNGMQVENVAYPKTY